MQIPDRGDVVYLDFNHQSGREQAGRSLAIVLSPKSFIRATGYASVCPISQTSRKWGFHVHLPDGLIVDGVVITDQVKNLDFRARNIEIKGEAPENIVHTCLKKIRTFL